MNTASGESLKRKRCGDIPTVDEEEDERLRGMGYRFEKKKNGRRIFAFRIRNKTNLDSNNIILEDFFMDGADFMVLKDLIGIYSPEKVRAISHRNHEHRVTSVNISNHYKIDLDKFCGLSELRSLILEDVLRVSIQEHSVQQLQKLEELTLCDCGWVGGMGAIYNNLVNLRLLNLSGSKFGRLSPSIGRLHKLQILDVSNCHLESIPEALWDLVQLKELNLSGNSIASQSHSIGRLQKLESLSLATTQLVSLPQAIGDLASLKKIYLWGTPIASLPSNFRRLQNLEILDVGNSSLQSLGEIGPLTRLVHLNLEQTAVEELPTSICSLSNLETLLLNDSKIAPFPKSIVEKLKRLRYLSVSKAHLQNHKGDILDVVKSCPLLVCITNLLRKIGDDKKNENRKITSFFQPKASAVEPNEDLLYALACNRARIRIFGTMSMPSGLWPLLLENAKRAFCWVPHDESDDPQQEQEPPWSDPDLYLLGLQNAHDAIYRLLLDGNERNSGWFRTASS